MIYLRRPLSGVLLTLCILAGCRSHPAEPPLPTYALADEAAVVRAIAERAKAVRSVSATCGLTLTKPDGQSVALDGILLSAAPDKLRLQATKFNTKLFDLTLNADGLFVRVDDPSRKDKLIPASANAGRFVREWALFTGGLFDSPDVTTRSIGADKLVATRTLSDGRRVECEVDRATLTPRLYRMVDSVGVQRFSLAVPAYRIVDGTVYPDHMTAVSEQGTIDIQMRDVELNVELPEGAFVPPEGSEKQP